MTSSLTSPTRFVTGIAILVVVLGGAIRAQQQSVPVGSTLGTVGSGVPGEGSTPGSRNAPSGAAPRLANGRPDFNGVWDHPYVPDMTLSAKNAMQQKGAGPLPFTPAGVEKMSSWATGWATVSATTIRVRSSR